MIISGRPSRVLFSIDERVDMIQEALQNPGNIVVMPFTGLLVDFVRHIEARIIIRGLRVFSDFEFEFRSAWPTNVWRRTSRQSAS